MAENLDAVLRARSVKRVVKWIVWLAVIAAACYGIYLLAQTEQPLTEDMSRAVTLMGAEHIPEDSPKPEYNSNPPTSGPHWAVPAHVGFYTKEIPDERIVHNLEHGDIWVSYRPGIPQSMIDALRGLTSDIKVIVTPRAGNDTDIAAAGWGRLDAFDLGSSPEQDLQRISDFILRYKNKGPESVIDSGAHLPK